MLKNGVSREEEKDNGKFLFARHLFVVMKCCGFPKFKR